MRNVRILIMLIISMMLFSAACAKGKDSSSKVRENKVSTPVSATNTDISSTPVCSKDNVSSFVVQEDILSTPASMKPTKEGATSSANPTHLVSALHETDKNGSFVLRMRDVAGDSAIKLIEASKLYNEDEHFKLKIVYENGQAIEGVLNSNLLKEDFFYCVDMTGDGYPEIAFPDLGYENSKGLSAPLILEIENGQIVEIPLFTINEGSENFSVPKSGVDKITVASKQTGKEYVFDITPLSELKKVHAKELQFVAPSTGVYSCDISHIAGSKYGLTWKSFIELWFEINGAGEPYAAIVATVVSTAEYSEGRWAITEELQTLEYQ